MSNPVSAHITQTSTVKPEPLTLRIRTKLLLTLFMNCDRVFLASSCCEALVKDNVAGQWRCDNCYEPGVPADIAETWANLTEGWVYEFSPLKLETWLLQLGSEPLAAALAASELYHELEALHGQTFAGGEKVWMRQ